VGSEMCIRDRANVYVFARSPEFKSP